MLTSTILALLVAAPPTNFEGLMRAMAADSRKLKKYQDSWILTTKLQTEKVVLKVRRAIDGERGAMIALLGDAPLVHLGTDGKASFFVLFRASTYAQTKGNAWLGRDAGAPPPVLEDGDFNFNTDGPYDFLISTKPALKLTGFETGQFEGKACRIAKCFVRRPETGSGVELKMWFPVDSYLLNRAEATVTLRDQRQIKFTAVQDRVAHDVEFEASEFEFPPLDKSEMKELAWKDLVPGFQG